MAVRPPVCEFGWQARDFELPSTDGSVVSLDDLTDGTAVLIMFICNHCPYVIAAMERLAFDCRELMTVGVKIAAICSNDATTYPADSFERMTEFVSAHKLPFPYLHDESQAVAKAYNAQCTPDFFGFNSDLELNYRGRLDDAGSTGSLSDQRDRDLVIAMKQIIATGNGPRHQTPSIGCSIKWKGH